MAISSRDHLKQVDELLAANNQSWLFGAGISLAAGIPLMGPLTTRINAIAGTHSDAKAKEVIDAAQGLLPSTANIEDILSHLADFVALAERSTNKSITIGPTCSVALDDLRRLHEQFLTWIAETIRWGYVPAADSTTEKVGSRSEPIVDVTEHQAFISALFNRTQAGISERRLPVKLFSLNYDTLLEDALALNCCSYWDGFAGGALAYRCFHYGDEVPRFGHRAQVIKIHGSIDWHLGDDGRVWRVRDGDRYPSKRTRVLIYPQATKYLATQRDPFAAQFDLLRRVLNASDENVLCICGYSFCDNHVNQEIELALRRSASKTTVLAFSRERNETLRGWQEQPWGNRVYVMAEDGLYVGAGGPLCTPSPGATCYWWTFDGVTNVLKNGAEASVK